MRTIHKHLSRTLALIVAAPLSLLALAADVNVMLNGDQEVPPVSTGARGTGVFKFGDDGTVSGKVTTTGINGTAAHIHEAASGKNGGVIIPLVKDGNDSWAVPSGAKLSRPRKRPTRRATSMSMCTPMRTRTARSAARSGRSARDARSSRGAAPPNDRRAPVHRRIHAASSRRRYGRTDPAPAVLGELHAHRRSRVRASHDGAQRIAIYGVECEPLPCAWSSPSTARVGVRPLQRFSRSA